MGRFLWKTFKFIVAAGALGAVLGGVLIGVALLTPLPKPELPVATEIYDVQGRLITKLKGPNYQNRTSVPAGQIPDDLKKAVVAIEDARFYHHHGIDPIAIGRAFYRDLQSRRVVEGGSTITQQLAKNLFTNTKRTVARKLQDAFYAIKLEAEYSKQEILTLYLNQIYLGHGTYGVQAASQLYFGKNVQDLTLAESATLAGIIRSPEYYTPYRNPEAAESRRNLVLQRMVDVGYLSAAAAAEAKQEPLVVAGMPATSDPAPYFVQYVVDELTSRHPLIARNLYTGGYRIYTTLNLDAQLAANKAVQDFSPTLDERTAGSDARAEVALVALDPSNGNIVAMVGGREYHGEQNRAVESRRQPGSAFKAILYTAVFEQGYTVIDTQVCEPVEFPGADGNVYAPKDYSVSQPYHMRPLTVREAVAESDNVVAVRWADQIKPKTIIEMGHRMGITSGLKDELGLALGVSEVSPLELTRAYATLANGGYRVDPQAVVRVVDTQGRVIEENSPTAERVISEQVAYLMTDVLKSVMDYGTGAGVSRRLGRPAAGKTGTTNDQRDTWFVGYTPELVSAVWVGFDIPKPLGPAAYGSTLPGPIWADFMRESLKDRPARDFAVPTNIQWVDICEESALLPQFPQPVVKEVFIKGTEPPNPCPEVPWWRRFLNNQWFTPEKRAENSRGSPDWFVPSKTGQELLSELEEQLRPQPKPEPPSPEKETPVGPGAGEALPPSQEATPPPGQAPPDQGEQPPVQDEQPLETEPSPQKDISPISP